MLQTTSLSYRYPGASEILEFPAIDCAAAQTRLLLGPSGVGKTTLLQILAGMRQPGEGRVTLAGQEVYSLSAAARDRFRGRHVGIVFQVSRFLAALSLEENLLVAQRSAGLPEDKSRARALLAELGLEGLAARKPHALSVGQRQRAGIARAVINEPKLLLADEPTSALDDANATRVLQLLQNQAERTGAALLIVTHDNRLTSLVPAQTTL